MKADLLRFTDVCLNQAIRDESLFQLKLFKIKDTVYSNFLLQPVISIWKTIISTEVFFSKYIFRYTLLWDF